MAKEQRSRLMFCPYPFNWEDAYWCYGGWQYTHMRDHGIGDNKWNGGTVGDTGDWMGAMDFTAIWFL